MVEAGEKKGHILSRQQKYLIIADDPTPVKIQQASKCKPRCKTSKSFTELPVILLPIENIFNPRNRHSITDNCNLHNLEDRQSISPNKRKVFQKIFNNTLHFCNTVMLSGWNLLYRSLIQFSNTLWNWKVLHSWGKWTRKKLTALYRVIRQCNDGAHEGRQDISSAVLYFNRRLCFSFHCLFCMLTWRSPQCK